MHSLWHQLCTKQTLSYVFFGIITVVVNYIAFSLYISIFGVASTLPANFVAFLIATAVAFLTNKRYVFHSTSWKRSVLKREITAFLGARVFSFIFEEGSLFLCLHYFHIDNYSLWGLNCINIAKIVLSGVVIIMNYILSKFFIFNPRPNKNG